MVHSIYLLTQKISKYFSWFMWTNKLHTENKKNNLSQLWEIWALKKTRIQKMLTKELVNGLCGNSQWYLSNKNAHLWNVHYLQGSLHMLTMCYKGSSFSCVCMQMDIDFMKVTIYNAKKIRSSLFCSHSKSSHMFIFHGKKSVYSPDRTT